MPLSCSPSTNYKEKGASAPSRVSSALVMSRGQRFESARRLLLAAICARTWLRGADLVALAFDFNVLAESIFQHGCGLASHRGRPVAVEVHRDPDAGVAQKDLDDFEVDTLGKQ